MSALVILSSKYLIALRSIVFWIAAIIYTGQVQHDLANQVKVLGLCSIQVIVMPY